MAIAIEERRGQPSTEVHPGCRILDPKLRVHARHYVIQCLAATAVVFVVLLVLDAFRQTVLVAALGASAFIAFTMPHVNSARPRYLVGGYVVGIAVGCLVSTVAELVVVPLPSFLEGAVPVAFAALATGLAMFIMVVTNTEHPPAAGLALGFVLSEWDLAAALVVLCGIIAISFVKETSRPKMMDLL